MNYGIVVIGSIFIDLKGYPNNTYIPAGRNAGRVEQVHGGVSRNVAEDIANVELRPTFISLADESGLSTDALEKLRAHRCNTDFIRRTPDGLGTWLAVFDHTGDVVASISRRPDMSPLLETLEESGDEIFANADSIVLEIDMDVSVLKKVLDLAEKHSKAVYAIVSNMTIAMERRDLLRRTACLVCNQQEAGILFSDMYDHLSPEEMADVLLQRVNSAKIPKMVVTMGAQGSVFAEQDGECGVCPAIRVEVRDTTGCGDAFFAGVVIGQTYGKSLSESCEIGTRLATAVIRTTENVCPRFQPAEFGIEGYPED